MPITEKILKKYANNDIFIETGTWNGGGIDVALSCGFNQIYSIEINEKHYNRAVKRFEKNSNVELILGDSAKQLGLLLKRINSPATFWLDAHTPDCPLMTELEDIKNHPVKTHTILIDDHRNFGKACMVSIIEDEVMAKLKEISPCYKISYEATRYGDKDIIVAKI